jgi:hypothetical protein
VLLLGFHYKEYQDARSAKHKKTLKTHFLTIAANFFLELEIFQAKLLQKTRNTHFTCSNFFLKKNLAVYEICGKYCTARQATDGNTANAHCMCWIPTFTKTHSE